MLHMEHGHVLVYHALEPSGRHGGDELEQLLAIEIVRRRDPRRALLAKALRSQFIRAIERKISNNRQPLIDEKSQAGEIADQDAVSAVLRQCAKDACFARLLNPRRGEQDVCIRSVSDLHGFAILADIGEVDVHALRVAGEDRL
jgi:hypothetical protein